MAITSLTTREFTVFNEFNVTFGSGINIIIGSNGTGKTHLLKMIYASQFAKKNTKELSRILKCFGVKSGFHNVAAKMYSGEKVNDKNQSTISVTVSESFDKQEFFPRGWEVNVDEQGEYRPIFISDRELLNHAQMENPDISAYFETDQIFYDTFTLLTSPKLDDAKIEIEMLTILRKITWLLDGKVIFKKGRFFIEKTNGKIISFDMEADAVKKVALLYRLIEVGAINKGSTILWDGIDNHLDKGTINAVCEILIALSNLGVQVIITTVHNEILGHFEGVVVQQPYYIKLYKENSTVKCNQYR